MDFEVNWKDKISYHKDECEKTIATLQWYMFEEKNIEIRLCYKQVMISIVEQHHQYLLNYASKENVLYDTIDFKWVADLRQKINKFHDSIEVQS
jgi:hypothetical protein